MRPFIYFITKNSIRIFARLLLRLKAVGLEHVPRTGPLLFAPNHVSYLDIPMLAAVIPRPLHFVGKSSLFRGLFSGWFYRSLNGIPLEYGKGSRGALMEAVRRLKEGHCVVIYPEGARSLTGRLQEPKAGIGMLAAMSGAKVIPVYVDGTDKALPVGSGWIRFHPVVVYLGEPMDFSARAADSTHKDLYSEISREIMDRISGLEARAKAKAAVSERAEGRPAPAGQNPSRHD